MHRLFLFGLLLLLLAGCQGVVGPFQQRSQTGKIDDPRFTTDEQQVRVRDRLALPEYSPSVGPRTYAEPLSGR